ncbi:glycosyltransferase family 2 protein [Luminiphilus sp.]|nr:glycosyltransferase family 2 protein [Luminiphilus sp.]MDC3320495.1 glycosyltransferase family 2 protein [Luminiphilus sp.]
MNEKNTCLVVIPALNESLTIGHVVESVTCAGFRNVVVIDDASNDNTAEIAEHAGATVISLIEPLGAWGATQTGLRYAIRKGFNSVITMDADEQHPVDACELLLEELSSDRANVAVGSCPERGSELRKIAWKWIKAASGVNLQDLTSGFRAYDRLAIRRAASWRGTLLEYQDIGVLLLLQRHGLVIVDVPVNMRPRAMGGSRIFYNWSVVAYYMTHTLVLSACKRIGLSPYQRPAVAPKVFL